MILEHDVWFVADAHFSHEAIIKHASRPFDSAKEMDEVIIENWNSCVKPGDRVYHLGDFAFCRPERILRIAERLNGQLFLIMGNHDRGTDKVLADRVTWSGHYKEVKLPVDGSRHPQRIVLFHYPIESWNCRHHGAWHLHGHCHGLLESPAWQQRMDVGLDANNLTPVSYEQVKAHMATKEWRQIDHHRPRED